MPAYGEDLAHIHDVGFGDFARRAAPGLRALLRRAGITAGVVVDLGCGSGIWAGELAAAGYRVVGIDQSPAMIDLARRRVPAGDFRTASLWAAEVPPCAAVTAVGECFNYLSDRRNSGRDLDRLFRRLHGALRPGGLLVFDVATPGRTPGRGPQRTWREGEGWAVLVAAEEDAGRLLLTRHIRSFRKVGELYRRGEEVHRLRLFRRADLTARLRGAGFRVRLLGGYGTMRFGRGHVGFLARKAGPTG